MNILPVSDIREADLYTIKTEPIADIDLMERAALTCCRWIEQHLVGGERLKFFCGSGNNGGDGLAIARMLVQKRWPVEIFLASDAGPCSSNCKINYERLLRAGEASAGEGGSAPLGAPVTVLSNELPLPDIPATDIVIDAVFGNGLTRPVTGFFEKLIRHINQSGARIISIDVPSGFFCDSTNHRVSDPVVVKADYTLTFSPPKLGFFFPENDRFTGNWQLLDIGLREEFIASRAVKNILLTKEDCQRMLKKRAKFAHKGNFGHALIMAGSEGKMGAAILAARGCLKSGAGLVSVKAPRCGTVILQTAVPEAMSLIGTEDEVIAGIPALSAYNAIAIGPGIGRNSKTAGALKLLIQQSTVPLVVDADAINLLSENKTWLGFLPHGSVLTPHIKEFERIAGKSSNDFERNDRQREFSFKYQSYVVLKGAHTAITTPEGLCYFNTTGNPGMATGGSGDVLTGIITGLMAQGYTSLESCLLGVYLHGLAGDLALLQEGYEALVASDIIHYLGKSFQTLYGKL